MHTGCNPRSPGELMNPSCNPMYPGEPVAGSSVQEGGLDLRLTLHKIGDTAEPLTDDHNPRSQEGLFRGRASGAFEPTVLLMG